MTCATVNASRLTSEEPYPSHQQMSCHFKSRMQHLDEKGLFFEAMLFPNQSRDWVLTFASSKFFQ